MNPKPTFRNFLALAGSAIFAISSASAATLYWDGTTTTANADGGTGNWDNTTTNWDTLNAAGADIDWTAGDIAVFSGTGATVTLTDNITVGGLTFNKVNGGSVYYTLDAAAYTLSFASGDNTLLFNNGNGGPPSATITGQLAGSGANVIVSAQSSVFSGGGSAGTLTLNGTSTGGWSGTTTINHSMTLSLAAANRGLANTSGITLNSGAIVSTNVDSTQAAYDRFNDSAGITINGGGSFTYTNTKASARVFAETLGAVTLNSGQFNAVLTNDQNSGGGNVQTLTLGSLGNNVSGSGLARTTTTSAVTFSAGTTGPNATTNRIAVYGAGTTSGWVNADPSNSIIGAWATTGTTAALQNDYAVYNGGYVAAANTAASAETSWGDATKQYTLSYATKTATALTATRNIAALKASTPIASVSTAVLSGSPTFTVASGHSFAVNDPVVIGTAPGGFVAGQVYYVQSVGGGGTTFTLSATLGGAAINATSNVTATFAGGIKLDSGITLGTTGILNSGTSPIAIGRTAAGGQISLPTAAVGNLFINAGSGNIGIDAPIVNNGGASNHLTVVKTGSGILHLSGSNTFSGGIVVNAGTLRLSGDQSFTGGVTLSGGAFGDAADGISAIELDSNSVTVNGNASMYSTSGETLAGAIAISSTGNLKLNGPSATLSGVVSGSGVLTLTSQSGAIVTLSNTANTHTGVISLVNDNNQNITLAVNSLADSASPGAGNIQMGGGAAVAGYFFALHTGAVAPLILNNRQVELAGDGPSTSAIFKLSNNSTQAFTINSNLLSSGTNAKNLTLGGSGAGLSTFAGTITNGSLTTLNLIKQDTTSTWALTNTDNNYNGYTSIVGTLIINSIADVGVNSSLGKGPASGAAIYLGVATNAGTLIYTGDGDSSNRQFRIGGVNAGSASGTILNNGTGALVFTAAQFNEPDPTVGGSNGNRPITLGGTYTGAANEIQGNIVTNAFAGRGPGISKVGPGNWILSGTNTYTGATNVNGGTLQVKSGSSNLTQTLGALAFIGADGTLESNKSGSGTITTNFTSFIARTAGNTGNFKSTGGTNGTDNIVNVTGAAGFIDKGIYFNGADFAYRDALNTFARAPIYGTDSTFITTATASNHVKLSSSYSGAGMTLLSLNLAGSAVGWTNSSGNLTVPGIIKSGGGSESTISGGNLTTTSNAELVIRTDTASDSLAISSNLIQGSGALTKSGAGTLTLSGNNDYTGQTFVNSGVLSIGANINLGKQTTGAQLNLRGGTLQASGTFGLFNGTAGTNDRAVVLTDSAGFDVTSSNTLNVAGVVSGTGSLTKFNTGTLTLTNTNTYTGTTTVNAGKLLVHGSTSASSNFTVNNGGTLGGTGTIGGGVILMSGSTLSPGASIESLGSGSNTWNGGSTVQIEFSTNGSTGAAGTEWDLLSITGTLDLTAASSGTPITLDLVTMLNTAASGLLTSWDANVNSTWSGFATTTEGITGFASDKFVFTTTGFANELNGNFNVSQNGNNLDLNYVTNYVVPEPRTALLGCLGALLLLRRRR